MYGGSKRPGTGSGLTLLLSYLKHGIIKGHLKEAKKVKEKDYLKKKKNKSKEEKIRKKNKENVFKKQYREKR